MSVRDELEALARRYGWAAVRDAWELARSSDPGALDTMTFADLDRPDAAPTLDPTPSELPPRYEDLGPIGAGGMGAVRRVRDRVLDRVVALKVAHTPWVRLDEEARVGAQLQHPGVPPVYDAGRLADGRGWFTMKEVVGASLRDHLRATRDQAGAVARVQLFARVCEALAYAHANGIVHGDVKSSNVVVGEHGEALVVDWGLARSSVDEPSPTVGGTLAYLAPEQLTPEGRRADTRTDVYALGVLLYEVLVGQLPYEGPVAEGLRGGVPGPHDADELVTLCERCMATDPAQRPADAGEVARAVQRWLAGVQRRERAHALVDEAERAARDVVALRDQVRAIRTEAEARLAAVPRWAPEADKVEAWAALDRADALEQEAELALVRREVSLNAALTHAPEGVDARVALAADQLARHRAAEKGRDAGLAARIDLVLARHADALPFAHPLRREIVAYRRGDGALTLVTDPPGAQVTLWRYEERGRRLVTVDPVDLGPTPIVARSVPFGSYLAVIRSPGRIDVRYPVWIERGAHWDGIPPGGSAPAPVWLPPEGVLGPDEVYVPAGPYRSGGDVVLDAAPVRRWCPSVVVARWPVTQRAYLAFLDALVAAGREEDAECLAPVVPGRGAPVCARGPDGRYHLVPDAEGDVWDLDWPVFQVDWHGARAYLAWWAERTGRPWRLPGEYEWEKAARGVDGRVYPWGDRFDSSWACTTDSHPKGRVPARVDTFPVDESPYGVRGVAGNVQQWCLDRLDRPADPETVPEPEVGEVEFRGVRMVRGGAWALDARYARSAARPRLEAMVRTTTVGFRGVWRPGS